jgi:hypothetical protein
MTCVVGEKISGRGLHRSGALAAFDYRVQRDFLYPQFLALELDALREDVVRGNGSCSWRR